MKNFAAPSLLLSAALFLAGCEYDAPLTTDHTVPIDPALVGAWLEQSDGDNNAEPANRLVVLKFSTTEYLIHYPTTEKEGAYYRGYPIQIGGVSCVQLELLGSAVGPVNEAKRYLVANTRLAGNRLEVRILNRDVIGTDLSGTAAIREAFLKHAADPALFNDPGVFIRAEDSAPVAPQTGG